MVFGRRRIGSSRRVGEAAGRPAPASMPAVPGTPGEDGWRGPFDLDDAPSDGHRRVDLGSLAVPVPAGVTIDVLPADSASADGGPAGGTSGERGALAVVTAGRAVLTLAAYAAPKSHGLWDDVRAGLAASAPAVLAAAAPPGVPGPVEEAIGDCGPELRLTIAVHPVAVHPVADQSDADQSGAEQPLPERPVAEQADAGQRAAEPWLVRVLGFDGPRWFLRATVAAPVEASDEADVLVAAVLRRVIVLRGTRAVPSGASLPLASRVDGADQQVIGLLGLSGTEPAGDGAGRGDGPRDALDDRALDDQLGRVRPTGAVVLDVRGHDWAALREPISGLSRNLATWG